jgi:hypothetical protein
VLNYRRDFGDRLAKVIQLLMAILPKVLKTRKVLEHIFYDLAEVISTKKTTESKQE